MSQDRFPQAREMADESMVRNLAAQAAAIWPQEERLYERYRLPGDAHILDVGCGTGEVSARLASKFPQATVLGVDIIDAHLALASARHAALAPRLTFLRDDAYALSAAAASMDLVVCRHVSQSIPDFHLVIAEMRRVLKPGGVLHLISEDYTMLHFPARSRSLDPDHLWHRYAVPFLEGTGTDGRIGRHSYRLLREGGFAEVSVDYVVVDTLRAPGSLAAIIEAWRDGFALSLAEHRGEPETALRARFDDLLAALADPLNYAVWQVPVIAGRKPA